MKNVHPGRRFRRALSEGKRNASRSPILVVWDLSKGVRGRLLLIACFSVVRGLLEASLLFLMAQAAVAISRGERQFSVDLLGGTRTISLSTALAAAALVVLGRLLVQLIVSWLSARMTTSTVNRMRQDLVEAYLRADWATKSLEKTGYVQQMLTGFVSRAVTSLGSLNRLFSSLTTVLTLAVTAFVIDPGIAGAMTLVFLLMSLAMRPFTLLARVFSRRSAQASLRFAQRVSEIASAAQEIQVFGVEPAILKRTERIGNEVEHHDLRGRLVNGMVQPIYLAVASLLLIGGLAIVSSSSTDEIAALSTIVLLFLRAASYGQQLQSIFQTMNDSAPRLEMLEETTRRYREAAITTEGDPLDRVGRLAFDRVDFSYRPDRPALHDVSFSIDAGEVVGLVGPSGAGKSTVVQLLLRLRDPTSGDYLINGRSAADFRYSDFPKRFTFVPQEAHLLTGTIADNISVFRREVDQARVEEAAKLAHVHDEIVRMPQGYRTPVGEGGRQLSGGQRQRVSIARALAGQPDVIVLDEPTSALDLLSESLIQQTLADIQGNVTMVIIAHRLSTLKACTRVMVVEDGRVAAFDTPEALLESNDFYREAVSLSKL
jgi:ATP-binding cassette, subfamily B, bacterial